MANQRPANPLPGTPLFDSPADGMAWMAKHRPGVPVTYYCQTGTDVWAAEEMPEDHPLRPGAPIMIFSVRKPRSMTSTETPSEEPTPSPKPSASDDNDGEKPTEG